MNYSISTMYKLKALLLGSFIMLVDCQAYSQSPLKTYGVQINVLDIKKALTFYGSVLGFETKKQFPDTKSIVLKPKTGNDVIILHEVSYLLPVAQQETRASLTLHVNNLDSSIAKLKAQGVDFTGYTKRKEGVGYAIYFDDPFGTRLSMMQQTVVSNPPFTEPRIYNYGFYVPDMDTAMQFFTAKLGFGIGSKKYLPLDLPLNNTDDSFGFMVHAREGIQSMHYNSPDKEHIVLLFQTADINSKISELKRNGVRLASSKISRTPMGNSLSFYNPFGYISTIIEIKTP